jgi:hypothetical protein
VHGWLLSFLEHIPILHHAPHHEVVLMLHVLLLMCEHVGPQVVVLQQGACEAGCQAGNNLS